MKSLIVILGLLTIVGMGMAEDFIQGEAKGADAPGSMMVGGNQSPEVAGIFAGMPVQLSGIGADIFDAPYFRDNWVFDTSSFTMTPSQAAFLKDDVKDGLPMVGATKKAFVGANTAFDDPRL